MTYKEAEWWILNDWEFLDNKLSKYYKKDVMALPCEGTKNIFFADKKTLEPIKTLLYSERNKKIKMNKTDILKEIKKMQKRWK